jgi:hypothetical protein
MKNAVMIVLVAALLAGVVGNIAQRQIYGPSAIERADAAKIAAAAKAQDKAAYDRATKDAAVDISPREFLWTAIPPVVIAIVGGLVIYRRWPHGTAPPPREAAMH